MKCKVGDKVIVNSGLKGDTHIGNIFCDPNMAAMNGKILTIITVDEGASYGADHYHVKENDWVWSDGMVTLCSPINLLEPCFLIEDCVGNTAMIMNSQDGLVFYSDEMCDDPKLVLDYFDTNLVAKDVDIINDEDDNYFDEDEFHTVERIYGLAKASYAECCDTGSYSGNRKLIWTRPAAVVTELTLDEVAKLAGVPVSQLKIKKQ